MRWLARVYSLKGLLLGLDEQAVARDPLEQFQRWYRRARGLFLPLPNACTLATALPDGTPDARMVLLKGADARGFVFYTNYESRKAHELDKNPRAVLIFHWAELFRQVRIEGRVERVSPEESDAYFASRPRGSQIGAWASMQSAVLDTREQLEQKVRDYAEKFRGRPVPRPPHWGGYVLHHERVEFWQGRPSRLHDRLLYTREGQGWKVARLSP
jgi:pyridoxamine 5'-phosphate oxidase